MVYTRLKNTTPPTQPTTQEVAQSQLSYKALGDLIRSQTLSLTTSYRVEYEVLLKKLSERLNLVRKNRGAINQLKLVLKRKDLKIES